MKEGAGSTWRPEPRSSLPTTPTPQPTILTAIAEPPAPEPPRPGPERLLSPFALPPNLPEPSPLATGTTRRPARRPPGPGPGRLIYQDGFFVRHAYFTGAEEPYDKLERALRAEIDEPASSALYSTTSCPLDLPVTGKIAIKIINHYGDDVLKVDEVA
ncbi:MAG: hypothetical protein AB1486_34150 [Planctomycetota bacterium]